MTVRPAALPRMTALPICIGWGALNCEYFDSQENDSSISPSNSFAQLKGPDSFYFSLFRAQLDQEEIDDIRLALNQN